MKKTVYFASVQEAAWPSGLGRWCCNPEVPGSRPPPCHQRDLFLGSPEFKSSVTLCKQPTGLPPASWDFQLCYVHLKYLFPLFKWHACKLAKLSACRAKCMTTLNKIYITIRFTLHYIHNGDRVNDPRVRNIANKTIYLVSITYLLHLSNFDIDINGQANAIAYILRSFVTLFKERSWSLLASI